MKTVVGIDPPQAVGRSPRRVLSGRPPPRPLVLSLPPAPLVDTARTFSAGTLDLCQELVAQGNADLKEMGLEPSPAKRAWLGGRAQVLHSIANLIGDDSPSVEDLEAEVLMRLSKAAEAVERMGHRDDAQYEVGRIAGLNLVRRLLQSDQTG